MNRWVIAAALAAIPATAHADDDEQDAKGKRAEVLTPKELHDNRRRVLDDADEAIDEAAAVIEDLRRRRADEGDEPTDPDEME